MKPDPLKFVPVMVTVVPPLVVPVVGVNEVTVGGGGTNVNSPVEVPVPPAVVTEILTVPAACVRVTALMVVGPVTVKLAAVVVPNLTAVAPMKPVPVTVTVTPPLVVPVPGVNEVMVGMGATYLKWLVDVAVPPTVVTETVTVPATCDLVTALIVVELVTVKLAAVVVPKLIAVAPVRLVPVMVTVTPPLVVPVPGVNEVMVGAATNLKSVAEVAVPPALVTETVTVPAACALVTALIVVELVTVKLAAVVDPNLTEVVVKFEPLKLVPVMVTAVPPVDGPAVGVREVTVGGGTKMKSAVEFAVPPTVVTETVTVPAECALVTALIVVGPVTV